MTARRHLFKTRRPIRRGRLAAALLVGGLALGWLGCGPPTQNVVVGTDGTSIRLAQIVAIRDNTNLSDSEKRQALRDLGITDETLIVILLR